MERPRGADRVQACASRLTGLDRDLHAPVLLATFRIVAAIRLFVGGGGLGLAPPLGPDARRIDLRVLDEPGPDRVSPPFGKPLIVALLALAVGMSLDRDRRVR